MLRYTHQVMLPFSIQLQDGTPVSDQMLLAVRKALLTGQMKAGDEFPSVRAMSQALRISPTTAHKVVVTD
jgi:GntR family transcriptional regulator